jgi:hypothetical protein
MCKTKEIKIIDAKHSILSEDIIDIQVMHDGIIFEGTLFKIKWR